MEERPDGLRDTESVPPVSDLERTIDPDVPESSGTNLPPPLIENDLEGAAVKTLVELFQEFRAPRHDPAADAAAIKEFSEHLSWDVEPGRSTITATEREVLDELQLLPVRSPQAQPLQTAVLAGLLAGHSDLVTTELQPADWNLRLAGMLVADRPKGRKWPVLGIENLNESVAEEVLEWIYADFPTDRVPDAVLEGLGVIGEPDAGVRAMLTLSARLLNRSIRVIRFGGDTIRFPAGARNPGPELVLVQDDTGDLLATVPQTAVPALLQFGRTGVLRATAMSTVGGMASDVGSFGILNQFLQAVAADPNLDGLDAVQPEAWPTSGDSCSPTPGRRARARARSALLRPRRRPVPG